MRRSQMLVLVGLVAAAGCSGNDVTSPSGVTELQVVDLIPPGATLLFEVELLEVR